MTTVELFGLGSRVRVRLRGCRKTELRDAIIVAWSRCLTPLPDAVAAPDLVVALREPGEPPAPDDHLSGSDLDSTMQLLTQQVPLRLIHARTGQLLMLHAGGLAHPETGASLAVVAAGGTGKTTLTQCLGTRLGYLSDETVGFDGAGHIAPYPKPLSVRGAGIAKHEISPDDLGLRLAPSETHVQRLVFLDRRPGAAGVACEELDTVAAIAALTPESSALSAFPRPLATLATLLDDRPPAVRITYAEASDLDDLLVGLLVAP